MADIGKRQSGDYSEKLYGSAVQRISGNHLTTQNSACRVNGDIEPVLTESLGHPASVSATAAAEQTAMFREMMNQISGLKEEIQRIRDSSQRIEVAAMRQVGSELRMGSDHSVEVKSPPEQLPASQVLSLQSYVPNAEGGAQTRIDSRTQSVTDARVLASPDFHFTVSSARGRPQVGHAEPESSHIRVYSQDFDGAVSPVGSPLVMHEHDNVPSHAASHDTATLVHHH